MTPREIRSELNKLYLKVAAIRGYIVDIHNTTVEEFRTKILEELQQHVEDILQKIDELESSVDEEHLGTLAEINNDIINNK